MSKARIAAVFIAFGFTGIAYAQHPAAGEPTAGCGTFQYDREHIGPLDYRYINPKVLKLVEDFHFSRPVEMLRGGQSSTIGGDLAYTLNAIPNHPRALRTTIEYFRRKGPEAMLEMRMSLPCWLDRAVAYRPDDPIVRILVADELIKKGNREEALSQLEAAEMHAGESATVHYNLGLLYLDLKDYDRSVQHARKAYDLGAPLQGLKNKLAQAGKWRD
ncbi:MAG: ABC transporter permease [Burkholderiaceae bacterium]